MDLLHMNSVRKQLDKGDERNYLSRLQYPHLTLSPCHDDAIVSMNGGQFIDLNSELDKPLAQVYLPT